MSSKTPLALVVSGGSEKPLKISFPLPFSVFKNGFVSEEKIIIKESERHIEAPGPNPPAGSPCSSSGVSSIKVTPPLPPPSAQRTQHHSLPLLHSHSHQAPPPNSLQVPSTSQNPSEIKVKQEQSPFNSIPSPPSGLMTPPVTPSLNCTSPPNSAMFAHYQTSSPGFSKLMIS